MSLKIAMDLLDGTTQTRRPYKIKMEPSSFKLKALAWYKYRLFRWGRENC